MLVVSEHIFVLTNCHSTAIQASVAETEQSSAGSELDTDSANKASAKSVLAKGMDGQQTTTLVT